MSIITRLDIDDYDFEPAFARLLVSPAEADVELAGTISNIVSAVAREGDAALLRFTNELDHRSVPDAAALRLDNDAIKAAAAPIEPSVCEALSCCGQDSRFPRAPINGELAVRG